MKFREAASVAIVGCLSAFAVTTHVNARGQLAQLESLGVRLESQAGP